MLVIVLDEALGRWGYSLRAVRYPKRSSDPALVVKCELYQTCHKWENLAKILTTFSMHGFFWDVRSDVNKLWPPFSSFAYNVTANYKRASLRKRHWDAEASGTRILRVSDMGHTRM